MSHIGILCPGAIGHINPMCNLGSELQERGHTVTFLGPPDVGVKVSQTHLNFHEIGATVFPLGSLDAKYEQLGQLSGIAGIKFAISFFQEELGMFFQEAPDAIRALGIELLLVDQITTAGGTIADHLSLSYVTVCNALPLNREPGIPPLFTSWEYQKAAVSKLRNQMGNFLLDSLTRSIWNEVVQQRKLWQLPPYQRRNDAYSQLLQIAQLPQELDFPRSKTVPWFYYVGPLKNPENAEPVGLSQQAFSFEDLKGKPLIYASLGTLQSRNWEIFHVIAEACLNFDAQLVISLGNPDADLSKANFAGNPIVAAFPPHQKLINRATLVITHAGSTAVNCLSAGVPMVAIPITTDQPGMAARVATVGAGEVVPLKQLTVDVLRVAIGKVLNNPRYRENAVKMQIAIGQAGGTRFATDLVEQLIQTGQPVLNGRR
jgi:zeaxanthin glucosyltransferase